MAISFPLILLFYENIFNAYDNLFKSVHGVKKVNPFKDLVFWINDPETLVIINKRSSLILAVRIFKLNILPEYVHPTLNHFLNALYTAKILNHFLNALYTAKINFSYQIVQTPLINQKNRVKKSGNNDTSIYFSVFAASKGFLTKNRINRLVEQVNLKSRIFKSHLSSNFHHTQIFLLKGFSLLNAIRAIFCGVNINSADVPKQKNYQIKISGHFVVKWLIIALFVIIFSYFSIYLSLPWFLTLIFNLVVVIGSVLVWWEDMIFSISKVCFLKNIDVKTVDPFIDIDFYHLKRCRDSLFMLLENNLLIGLKMFNLQKAFQKCFMYPDKLFRELNNQKLSFIYTLQTQPLLSLQLGKHFRRALNEKGESDLVNIFGDRALDRKETIPRVKNAPQVFEKWLNMRTGIWDTILTISVLSYTYLNQPEMERFCELEEELISDSEIMIRAFEDNFLNLKLRQLYNHILINGYRFISLKTSLFKPGDTRLSCVYFQGKNLKYLVNISNEFKKGIETRVPAEFNTPFHLKNDIVIGETINTEFLEREAEMGFTIAQVKQLLITNGLTEQREHTMMRIVTELTKMKIPCIIFDYSGKWSKLINTFKNTVFEDTFLYFKLGRSLSIDLIKSDIKHDERNIEYLNLFFDVFALAFKEQKRTVDLLKETISQTEMLTLEDIALDQEMEKKLIKHNEYNSLLALLHGFIDWRAFFASNSFTSPQEIKTIDFITNNKSIVIDLSLLEKMNQKNFISFVVLSKFIHYLQNTDIFYPKIIAIPDVDLFFDGNYIDNYNSPVDFGRINKFIATLLQKGFGFIFSVNQIRYLHSQVLSYFPNIITFKATDMRDIMVLKNQMNLQELQGTGYYSSKRNNSYQIEYLKNLQDNEVIMKRSDIPQPFPGVIDYEDLMYIKPLSRESIVEHMKEQGYDYIEQEKKILAGIKRTLLEKDLGKYSVYINEIINFLDAISSVDKIGGNYEQKLKKVLLTYIYPKASKKLQTNKKINELRDFIFQILITQGYLVESHPSQAGGGQTVRTGYKVGEKYYKALDDYYKTKSERPSNITVNTIEKGINGNSNIPNLIENISPYNIIRSTKFSDLVCRKLGSFIWQWFKLHQANEDKRYNTALQIGKNLIFNYLTSLYEIFLKMNGTKTPKNTEFSSFIKALTSYKVIPYTMNKLNDCCQKSEELSQNAENPEKNARELEELIREFYKTTRRHFMQN
jgi:hypothetical protein